jgi:hypothetical protein
MKKYLPMAILLATLFAPHTMAAQFDKSALIAENNTSLSAGRVSTDEAAYKKSPLLAFGIGLVPGFVLHGVGHIYARDEKTAKVLLVTEAISIGCMYYSFRKSGGVSESASNVKLSNSDIVGFTGIILFACGWIIDFADAPHQVNKRKAAYMNMQKISLGAKKGAVAVSYSFEL